MQSQQLRYILRLFSSNKLPDDYSELIDQLGIDNCLYLNKTNGDFVKLYFKIRRQTIFTSPNNITYNTINNPQIHIIQSIDNHHIPITIITRPYFEYGEI